MIPILSDGILESITHMPTRRLAARRSSVCCGLRRPVSAGVQSSVTRVEMVRLGEFVSPDVRTSDSANNAFRLTETIRNSAEISLALRGSEETDVRKSALFFGVQRKLAMV